MTQHSIIRAFCFPFFLFSPSFTIHLLFYHLPSIIHLPSSTIYHLSLSFSTFLRNYYSYLYYNEKWQASTHGVLGRPRREPPHPPPRLLDHPKLLPRGHQMLIAHHPWATQTVFSPKLSGSSARDGWQHKMPNRPRSRMTQNSTGNSWRIWRKQPQVWPISLFFLEFYWLIFSVDVNGGLNQSAIDEWECYIFKKMEERDENDEDHELEDYLWMKGGCYLTHMYWVLNEKLINSQVARHGSIYWSIEDGELKA